MRPRSAGNESGAGAPHSKDACSASNARLGTPAFVHELRPAQPITDCSPDSPRGSDHEGVPSRWPIRLAGGSLIPFQDCRSALLAGDAPRRRAAFSRCKAMLMLGLVIVLRILSDDGFLSIQIGRAGSFPPVFFSSETATIRRCHQSPRW